MEYTFKGDVEKMFKEQIRKIIKDEFGKMDSLSKNTEPATTELENAPLLSYEEFQGYIKKISWVHNFYFDLFKLSQKYETDDFCLDDPPHLIDESLELLAKAMNDNENWINFWFFDINCGKEDDKCTEINGRKIALTTIKDLYDVLIGNPHYL